jgi:hypothetical protein
LKRVRQCRLLCPPIDQQFKIDLQLKGQVIFIRKKIVFIMAEIRHIVSFDFGLMIALQSDYALCKSNKSLCSHITVSIIFEFQHQNYPEPGSCSYDEKTLRIEIIDTEK